MMTRAFGRLFMALAAAGSLTFGSLYGLATGDSIASFTVKGVVPAIVTPPNMGGLEAGGEAQPFGVITEADFTQGYVEADGADRLHMQGMKANVPVEIRIQNNGWTLPAGYDTVNGPKSADGSDNDFLIFVDPVDVTAVRGQISAIGAFGVDFTPVTNVPAGFLQMGSDPASGTLIGVDGGEAYITPRMNLDPIYDIPGDYVVQLEMTVALPFP